MQRMKGFGDAMEMVVCGTQKDKNKLVILGGLATMVD